MFDEHGNPTDVTLWCHVTEMEFERPDMIASAKTGPDGQPLYLSSLALSTDRLGEHVLPADPGGARPSVTRGRAEVGRESADPGRER